MTATNLENAIDGNRVVFNGKSVEGQFAYVMDTNGNIIFGKRYNPNNSSKRSPHPTLIGGKTQKCNVPELLSLQKAGFLVLMIAAVTINRMQNQCLSQMKHSQNCHLHYFQKNSKGEISNYAKLKIKNRILI